VRPSAGAGLPGLARGRRVADFRDAATKAADAALVGTWWRCEEHGLTDAPVGLGSVWYCAHDPCERQVLPVGGATRDINKIDKSAWNKATQKYPPRQAPPEVEDIGAAPPMDQPAGDAAAAARRRRGPVERAPAQPSSIEGSPPPSSRYDRRSPEKRAKGPTATELLLQVLRAAPGRAQTFADLRKWLQAARPDMNKFAPYQAVNALLKRGLVTKHADGRVELTDAGAAHAQLEAAHGAQAPVLAIPAQERQSEGENASSSGERKQLPEREGSPPRPRGRTRIRHAHECASPPTAPEPVERSAGTEPGTSCPPKSSPEREGSPSPTSVVVVRSIEAPTSCEVCERRLRRREPHVVIVTTDGQVPVCAECAALADDAMRAAAAPLLLAVLKRRRRAS